MKFQGSDNQPALPFSTSPTNTFHEYLHFHRLLWTDVAKVALVPAITVWSVDHGLHIHVEHAKRICNAVERMTGVPFRGSIPTIGNPNESGPLPRR